MKIEETNISSVVPMTNFNIETHVPIISDKDGFPMFNLMTAVKIPQDINPVYYDTYTPTENESFQTISYKIYGTIKLWWLICATNFIFDSTDAAAGGVPLKVIKPKYVGRILNQLN